jgi:ERCC4-type nuclease
MTIQIDSREKKRAIVNILRTFDSFGVKHFVSKLPCGDYCDLDNARFCIDRKQNLSEVCNNVCQDHKRFIEEITRANNLGIKLVFLVEHSRSIKTLEDVRGWKNPRLKVSPLAVSGERLYKILSTIEKNYNTKFYFCSKQETGRRIIELLQGELYEKLYS